jgi:hypothetical protein
VSELPRREKVDIRLAALRFISTGKPTITESLDVVEDELRRLRAAADAGQAVLDAVQAAGGRLDSAALDTLGKLGRALREAR